MWGDHSPVTRVACVRYWIHTHLWVESGTQHHRIFCRYLHFSLKEVQLRNRDNLKIEGNLRKANKKGKKSHKITYIKVKKVMLKTFEKRKWHYTKSKRFISGIQTKKNQQSLTKLSLMWNPRETSSRQVLCQLHHPCGSSQALLLPLLSHLSFIDLSGLFLGIKLFIVNPIQHRFPKVIITLGTR